MKSFAWVRFRSPALPFLYYCEKRGRVSADLPGKRELPPTLPERMPLALPKWPNNATAGRDSGQNLASHLSGGVGQPEVATGIAKRELLVVEAHEVQNRGVQVVRAHDALHGRAAQLIG